MMEMEGMPIPCCWEERNEKGYSLWYCGRWQVRDCNELRVMLWRLSTDDANFLRHLRVFVTCSGKKSNPLLLPLMLLRLFLPIELIFMPGEQYTRHADGVSPSTKVSPQVRSDVWMLQGLSFQCPSLCHMLTSILCCVLLVLLEWWISVRTTSASASLGVSQPVLTPHRSTCAHVAEHEGQQMGLCLSLRTGFGIRHLPREALSLVGHLSCFLAHITHLGDTPFAVPAWLPVDSPLSWHQPVPHPLPQLIVPCCPISAAALPAWQMFCKSGAVEAASAFCPALLHLIILVFCFITQPTCFSQLYF